MNENAESGTTVPQIRTYRPEDRAQVIAILEQVLGYTDAHNQATISVDRKAAYQSELFLVATAGSRILGTIMGGYDGHRGWIYSLAVAADARGQGIGTRLVRAVEQALADLECPKIKLEVIPENQEVVAFYEALGYNVEERISLGKRLIR